MFVKPAPDRVVPDPDRRDFLPAEGREVPDTPYWRRRRDDHDVIPAAAAKPTKPNAKEA